MVGGLNSDRVLTKSDEIARLLAERLQCNYHLLYAPAIVENEETRRIIMQDQTFATMLERINSCEIALLGVGELKDTATIYQQGYISKEQLDAMTGSGCVGDLAMQPFDKEGNWHNFLNVIGVETETLKRIPNVTALACGAKKAEAVMGALATGCINNLLVDRLIADQMVARMGLR
jgi:DNA-binding transcriptional regulator LsrR (DeoR family)